MARHIVLLRGINIGPRNRIAMPALREALEEAGFTDVQTYLQSGNVVLESRRQAGDRSAEGRAADRGAVRPRDRRRRAHPRRARRGREAQPARQGRKEPKRYQVTFLSKKLPAKVVRELEEAAAPDERVVVAGREVYAWHPQTSPARSSGRSSPTRSLGVTATSRNWTTVEALLELAGG